MANTTWNPADKSAGVTLSNLNLTAAASGAGMMVRTIDKQTTGKFYWEVTATTAAAAYGVGCANATASDPSIYATAANAFIVYYNGPIWINGANSGVSVPAINGGGTIVCFALDLGNGRMWARTGAAGNWNGSGTNNPATNVGGIAISAISASGLYPAAAFNGASSFTANFGDSAFAGVATLPAGFTSGFPGAGGAAGAAQARAMVLA